MTEDDELEGWDLWNGEHVVHVTLCSKHVSELGSPIYAPTYASPCEYHQWEDYCVWCERTKSRRV